MYSKVIQLYAYVYFFQILSPFRLLHNIEQSSSELYGRSLLIYVYTEIPNSLLPIYP